MVNKNILERAIHYTNQGAGGRVLPFISDRCVPTRVLNPDPIKGRDKRKFTPHLRPKHEKCYPILHVFKGKTKAKDLAVTHKPSSNRFPDTIRNSSGLTMLCFSSTWALCS